MKLRQMQWEDVAWRLGNGKNGNDNGRKLLRLRLLALRVIQEELSDRQRQMLYAYFFEGKKMVDIAAELNLNKSTVSRTIARGIKNLRSHLKYYPLR